MAVMGTLTFRLQMKQLNPQNLFYDFSVLNSKKNLRSIFFHFRMFFLLSTNRVLAVSFFCDILSAMAFTKTVHGCSGSRGGNVLCPLPLSFLPTPVTSVQVYSSICPCTWLWAQGSALAAEFLLNLCLPHIHSLGSPNCPLVVVSYLLPLSCALSTLTIWLSGLGPQFSFFFSSTTPPPHFTLSSLRILVVTWT